MKKNIIFFTIVFFTFLSYGSICFGQMYKLPDEQPLMERKYDKNKILRKSVMQTDSSQEFITMPQDYPDVIDFDVAKTPPAIDFAIIQGFEPWYLPSNDYRKGGHYAGWGDVTKGPDGCFYFSIGNHGSYGGTAYVIKYNPSTKSQEIVVNLKEILGSTPDDFIDGKFHGDLDIGSGGDMWILSYFGPAPTREELDTVYRGGSLLKHNIFTGETKDFGIALEGESFVYHTYDWQRNVLFAVGTCYLNEYVFVYDTKANKMIYGGAPPQNICWYERCVLLDRETGVFYSTDSITHLEDIKKGGERFQGDHYFVSYVRRNNKFTRMQSTVPANPVTGKKAAIRAHTKRKDDKGAFWCFSDYGTFFKFYPEEDRVELVGVNWGKEGSYIANMCLSPKGRYIYYIPNAGFSAYKLGTPIVQYDIKTNQKKIIAFMYDFYMNNYGYNPAGTYGIELDEKGESLFFYMNGEFTTKELSTAVGRPSIFQVHIPASERME